MRKKTAKQKIHFVHLGFMQKASSATILLYALFQWWIKVKILLFCRSFAIPGDLARPATAPIPERIK